MIPSAPLPPNPSAQPSHHLAGFTLIEMIVAIVLLGIISVMVATFIRSPVLGYVDTVRRAELTDTADYSLRRIAREARLALPNSMRVTTAGGVNYIEFILTRGGGRYRDVLDGAGNSLNFFDATACATTPTNCQFDVMGVASASDVPIAVGDYIVANNWGQDVAHNSFAPMDAYAPCAAAPGCNIAQVSAVAGLTVTLTPVNGKNVFASQTPPSPSGSNRFQVVPGGVRAVTYACPSARGVLTRQANYGFNFTQGTPPSGGTSTVMANNASCVITYENNVANQRTGILTIALTLFDSSGEESVTLLRQIPTDNSP